MNRNNLWRFFLIVLVIAWSILEMYPPTNRDLIEVFEKRAVSKDETFAQIVAEAKKKTQDRPDRVYGNLQDAIGTNDVTKYFRLFQPEKQSEPTVYVLNQLQRNAAGKIKLGIDLQGGMSFLVQMDTNRLNELSTNENSAASTEMALSQAIEVLRKRVDKFGVAEPVIQPEGNNRILIQLPGLSEERQASAMATISNVAFLEFKIVHEESEQLVLSGNTLEAGYEFKRHPHKGRDGVTEVPGYLVRKRPELTGGIKTAYVTRDLRGKPEIAFVLEPEARERFAQITTQNQDRQLAIILDGELRTAPNIESPITEGNGRITGSFEEVEAFNIANVLENPLKTPLKIISHDSVDPTLGKDTIRSGIKACIIGVILVAVFMVFYYLLAGAVADVALICNVIILLGVMCAMEATLTLPGIAGIALTVGMAVDANVLIFERIREELAKGKSLRGALNAGYDRAFGTIFDSHVTTLISSVILIFMGTGSIKGFGVSLTIGVAASLFTALVVTRVIFDYLLSRNILKSLPMLHIIRTPNIDFMRFAIPAFIASWLLIVIGNSYGIFVRGSDVLGVDFVGGEKIVMQVNQQNLPPVDKVREVATRASGAEVLVAYQRDISTATATLQVTARHQEKSDAAVGDKIFQELKKEFPGANLGDRPLSLVQVGPTVGQEIQQTAVVAVLLALFGILVYVAMRYEFSFAVAAVIAIFHDVLMTLGWYFLAGREFNATTVAAVLTIIGFSINDTIVIFDRIREDLRLGVRGTFRELVNKALNQTLSRTIITSGTVFLATMSLFIFGGGPINDFAFTFLVGIITGTYSSIYIAAFIVLRWHKGHRPKIGNTQLAVDTVASPAQG